MPIMMIFVLLVIALIVITGLFSGRQVQSSGNLSTAETQIGTMSSQIESLYAQQGTFSGLTTASAIAGGVLPQNMVTSTTTAAGPFGGPVQIGDAGAAGLTPNPGFVIEYDGLASKDCQGLATGMTAQSIYIGSSPSLGSFLGGGSLVASSGASVTPAQAATSCPATNGSVAFVFDKSS